MKNLFKGIIIGIGKVLPGVSGAILAILLGIYDKSIYYINNFSINKKESIKYLLPLVFGLTISVIVFSKIISICLDKYYLYTMMIFIGMIIGCMPEIINNFFVNKKESIKYLFPIAFGLTISVIIFSKIISICLDKYYLYTMMIFIGMIIGCMPEIINRVVKRDYLLIITSFTLFFLISIGNINNIYIIKNNYLDIIVFFISGILEAIGTVIPGISSAALLMVAGTYNIVVNTIGNITNIENIIATIKIIIPFVIGGFLGTIFLVKIIEYFLNNHKNKTYNVILGIVISSIVLLIVQVFKYKYNIIELIISIIFLILGITISSLFNEK